MILNSWRWCSVMIDLHELVNAMLEKRDAVIEQWMIAHQEHYPGPEAVPQEEEPELQVLVKCSCGMAIEATLLCQCVVIERPWQ